MRVLLGLLLATPVVAAPVFEDRSDAFPVSHEYIGGWEHFVGGGAAIFDCNGDALPDVFVAGGAAPARLFVNETDAPGDAIRFAEAEVAELAGVTGAYPLDLDGDGVLDLAVLRVGANVLLSGDGDCGFRDVTEALGFDGGDGWSTAFSATWEAGQSLPTLAVGNYVDRDDPEGPFGTCDANALYRPEGVRYGPPIALEPGYCALSMLISDWQRTGAPELRISNDRHYYVSGGYEEMWRLSPLQAQDAEDGWERVSLWGMGIASGDLAGDGFPDVMLTSMGDQALFFNESGTLRQAPFETGATAHRPHAGEDGRPSTGWHAEFGDIDNDGRLDLFIAKGNVDQMPGMAMEDPNNLLMQGADGRFEDASVAAGIATMARSRGGGLADFDGDGLLDILVVNRRAPLELWQNRTEGAGNWVKVALEAPAPNRFAVGAIVEIEAGGNAQTREVTVGGGHVSGRAGPVHVGLGDAEAARVRVLWPAGVWSEWIEVEAGRVVTLSP